MQTRAQTAKAKALENQAASKATVNTDPGKSRPLKTRCKSQEVVTPTVKENSSKALEEIISQFTITVPLPSYSAFMKSSSQIDEKIKSLRKMTEEIHDEIEAIIAPHDD
ncbi:hypothetical protein DdX_03926 [Ditylenchus destructor]|uniref:Uncharacterized protein n=1 Tax=Ditylenchus destructor TaxID=166010 RepID=A0AAD4NCW6_9BILA|nr:hypothetical protein DdX_03926 [Ditylenchus destructor]